jgi:hypothetical protein
MTADVRIRSTPLADEPGTFFLCILFPFQSAILCFPPHTLTRVHSDAALPCRTSARERSGTSLLRGERARWRRVRPIPSGDSNGEDVLREMWVDMNIREYSVVRRRAPRLRRAGANRCVSRQCSLQQHHILRRAHTPPADETSTFLLHLISSLLSANLSLPPRPLTRTPGEGTLPRRISALPRSSNSFLRGERRSPATRTGSVRSRRAPARTPHA